MKHTETREAKPYNHLHTAYISGPMTGYKHYNYPRFYKEADRLKRKGYTVLNPAQHNLDKGLPWAIYMKSALKKLLQADFLVMLEGWQDSRGAKVEEQLARDLDMPIIFWEDLTKDYKE